MNIEYMNCMFSKVLYKNINEQNKIIFYIFLKRHMHDFVFVDSLTISSFPIWKDSKLLLFNNDINFSSKAFFISSTQVSDKKRVESYLI